MKYKSVPKTGMTACWVLVGITLMFLAGCGKSHPPKEADPMFGRYGVTLFNDSIIPIQDYFQSHLLMVAPLVSVNEKQEGSWQVVLDYPSLNHVKGQEGSTVLYSHQATLIFDTTQAKTIENLDYQNSLLILEMTDPVNFEYRLVGYIDTVESKEMDWFADKPELLFKSG